MKTDLLLTFTSSMQFGLFGAIAVSIFGWMDKKDRFSDIGRYIFIALGFYALWILSSEQIQVNETITTDKTSRAIQTIMFFKGIVACALFAIIAFLLKIFKIRYYRFISVICIIFAIFLFFIVYRLQQG